MSQSSSFVKRHWFIMLVGIAVLLIGLSVVNFFLTHKKVAAPARYQLTQNANKNPFFASQLLLEAQGKQVHVDQGETAHRELKQVWQQPSDTAQRTSVLLLTVSKEQENDIPAMLDWVKRGGHLVTFSKNTLQVAKKSSNNADNNEQENEQENKQNLTEYLTNENALLNYLGIKNIQRDDPHGKLLASASAVIAQIDDDTVNPADTNPSNTDSTTAQPITLHAKVLLRLPTDNNKNMGTGIVMSSANMGYLDSQAFWQKYPQARPIADYNWFDGMSTSNSAASVASTPNQFALKPANQWHTPPLNAAQLATLKQTIVAHPQYVVPAQQALLDINLGQGRLTITNDNEVFTNPSGRFLSDRQAYLQQRDNHQSLIWQHLQQPSDSPNVAQFDNAYLLSYLLTGRDNVWLVPDISVPSLPVLLWRHLKWACIAFVLCTVTGLLALPKRFGRAKRYQNDSQSNIFGYFHHVGQYLWHNDQANALVSHNRERLLDKILARYPQLAYTDNLANPRQIVPERVCQVVADDLGIGYQSVALALFEPWHTEQEFIRISREFALLKKNFEN